MSRLNTTDSFSKTLNVGTLLFMAPEIINDSDYDEKVDVYSFGVLIFYILSGRKMAKITMSEILLGKKAQIPSEFTQFSKDLINSCWNFNPSQRPSFNDIYNILKENNYNLFDLDEESKKDALYLINQHKTYIPLY